MTIKTEDLLDDAARVVAADLYPERCRTVIANLAAELITARAKIEAAEKLAEAMAALDKAASEVARLGAVTGPQWTRLTVASLKARSALAAWESLK